MEELVQEQDTQIYDLQIKLEAKSEIYELLKVKMENYEVERNELMVKLEAQESENENKFKS